MLRSIFSFFIFVFLSIISFYFTMFSISYLKELDPIMKEIRKNISLYEIDFVNAKIIDNSIIPGIKGKTIDVENSYQMMKKYGSYKKDLFIYKESSPLVSISNIYDKYVISGNKNKKEVSLVFKIENTNYLEELIFILKKNNVIGTFFIDKDILLNNLNVIDLLILNNQNIEMFSNKYEIFFIDKIEQLLWNYGNININYCYLDYYDADSLTICSFKKMHTIVPSINTNNYPYYDIKNNLSNGSIIKLDNNISCLYELDFIIKYIKQKNYKIISLKKMLNE